MFNFMAGIRLFVFQVHCKSGVWLCPHNLGFELENSDDVEKSDMRPNR